MGYNKRVTNQFITQRYLIFNCIKFFLQIKPSLVSFIHQLSKFSQFRPLTFKIKSILQFCQFYTLTF